MTKTAIKILLAEDQLAEMFIDLLSDYNGFEFTTVRRGEHAVREAQEQEFDLILMDLRIPLRMNGIEAIRQIRKFNQTVPIIAITAYTDRSSRERALAAGANDYVKKPPNFGKLYRRIIELISERPDGDGESREAKMKRLQVLRERAALQGFDAPAHVVIEIEQLEQELGIK